MNSTALKEKIRSSKGLFSEIYKDGREDYQIERYLNAVDSFVDLYGDSDNISVYSAPGRTEICGNHTDHNWGRVIAGSVNLDIIAVVSPNNSNIVNFKSEGYPKDIIYITDTAPKEEEKNQSASLIRGTASRFLQLGYKTGGFNCYSVTNVLKGSGLSSSAAFEVLVGTVFNGLFNDGQISAVDIAKIAQFAENNFFGKPCGLMDQMASSVGGIITIDFSNEKNPEIRKLDFDFNTAGYSLCIVDTGGNHADLTDEYAAIPNEMKSIAKHFSKNVLVEINKEDVKNNILELREKYGDRAVLRALHFFSENENVNNQVKALENNNFDEFLVYSKKSGNSSYKYLQNVYANINPKEQGIAVALYFGEEILNGRGTCRVHGGGFGGTTQNFVPGDMTDKFKKEIEKVVGRDKCHILNIRNYGGIKVF